MLLLDLLISQNRISEDIAKEIKNDLEKNNDEVIDNLLSKLYITGEELTQIRSVLYGYPIYKGEIKKDAELSKFISTIQAKSWMALPLEVKDDVVYVGVVDPDRGNILSSLQFLFGGEHRAYKIFLISFDDFKNYLGGDFIISDVKDNVNGKNNIDDKVKLSKINEKDANEVDLGNNDTVDLTDVDAILDDKLEKKAVPMILNILLRYAIDHNASDIHIEDSGSSVRVRCRVDGVLNTVISLPIKVHSMIVARVKILCAMKLDEKRKPQDGRFSTKLNDRNIDYRVSTFPGYYGEKVVIRVLDSYKGVRELKSLGFSISQIAQIRDALTKPYGIVLISGPTGSGKTTTLYSMLNEIDRDHRNVVSLEDPIEYNVPNMNQSQIFPEIGYTFATGLRSILRQDPDVIMVGEIRDAETAELAIQAALTGHLVFSTIHTNTAVGVITRLLDMGVEPFLIAPTLILTIGQRLVRKIDDTCASPLPMDVGMKAMIDEEFKELGDEFKSKLKLDRPFNNAVGNENNPSGLKGRIPVLEVLELNNEIQECIVAKKGEDEITDVARKFGMITMRQDAMLKSMEGIVPFSEIHEL